jgi:hypothetical protein
MQPVPDQDQPESPSHVIKVCIMFASQSEHILKLSQNTMIGFVKMERLMSPFKIFSIVWVEIMN